VPLPGVYAFEQIDDSLPYVPVAARRVLDALGRKLSLEGWASLPLEDRVRLVAGGSAVAVDQALASILDGAERPPGRLPPEPEPDAERVPEAVAQSLGGTRAIDAERWRTLKPLDRYTLAKYASKPAKLAAAFDEIVGGALTHVSSSGEAHMVDVSGKRETHRRAVATALVRTTSTVARLVAEGAASKGDVLGAARIAGIAASKRTPELVPLCHPVRTTHASVELAVDVPRGEVRVKAVVEAVDRTGVEMEAMVAASVASLTVYDMIKSADRWATIEGVRLEEKSGGKSGDVTRPGDRA
jgi:cyclic pyranopterin monophosphate synthase